VPNKTQSQSLLQEAIYGIAAAVAIVAIAAVSLVLRKKRKAKAKTHNKLENCKKQLNLIYAIIAW
jgi:hypothetical protein